MASRTERLARIEARQKERVEQAREALLQAQARRKAAEEKERRRRCFQVGVMAEEAGLLRLSDSDLMNLLKLLGTLDVPDPAKFLEGLLHG